MRFMLSKLVSNVRQWWRLRRLDSNTIPADEDCQELRLFMFVRNESLRLPFFLKHYRSLGINRFFIVDNGSTDNTVEFLLQQSDVHVWSTQELFSKADFGMNWLNYLLQRYGIGRWCVVVDADEFFALPWKHCTDLQSLCSVLQEKKAMCMRCFLLDLFPKEPLANMQYKPGEDLFAYEWYYDADTSLYDQGAHDNICGGVRQRVFGVQACLVKHPIFFVTRETHLQLAMHLPAAHPVFVEEGVLLHFKYLQDFADRVIVESKREEHWKDAMEYKAYANIVQEQDTSLWHPNAVLFKGYQQLADQGFITVHP